MPKVSVGRAELDTRPHLLYRFYDRTGVLLYIGITVDFGERQKHHAKYKKWWTQVDHDATKVEYYNGRRPALDAERDAIKAEKPLENDQHNEFVDSGEEVAPFITDLFTEILDYIARDDEYEELLANIRSRNPGLGGLEIRAKACSHVVRDFWVKQYEVANLLRPIIRLLPNDVGRQAEALAYATLSDQGEGGQHDGDSLLAETLEEVYGLLAVDYLAAMGEAERAEWMAGARAEDPDHQDDQIHVNKLAATHASAFKAGLIRHRTGMCANSGDHGAMCPRAAANKVWIVDCDPCGAANRVCNGHVGLCDEHLVVAKAGLAYRKPAGATYQIFNSEPCEPSVDAELVNL